MWYALGQSLFLNFIFMNKKLFALTLTAALSPLLLSGCFEDSSMTTPPPTPPVTPPTTMTTTVDPATMTPPPATPETPSPAPVTPPTTPPPAKNPPAPTPAPKPQPAPTPVPPPAPAPAHKFISIANFAFAPASISVNAGDTVTWTNKDSMGHSVVADGGGFQSSVLNQDQSFSHVFSSAGTFSYHCGLHPSMKGTVTVK